MRQTGGYSNAHRRPKQEWDGQRWRAVVSEGGEDADPDNGPSTGRRLQGHPRQRVHQQHIVDRNLHAWATQALQMQASAPRSDFARVREIASNMSTSSPGLTLIAVLLLLIVVFFVRRTKQGRRRSNSGLKRCFEQRVGPPPAAFHHFS
jgi:hypothetical protein